MSETTYYERKGDVILNRAKYYYKNNKELLRKEQKITIKREYGRNRYHNMFEQKKQRLKEYQRNYREAKKHFIDVKNQLIVLSKKIHIVIKVHFYHKLLSQRYFFISASDNDKR